MQLILLWNSMPDIMPNYVACKFGMLNLIDFLAVSKILFNNQWFLRLRRAACDSNSSWNITCTHGCIYRTWMPCSRQYSSQQALPIWMPAWPMWMERHSLMVNDYNFLMLPQRSTSNKTTEVRSWSEYRNELTWSVSTPRYDLSTQ